MIFWLIVQEISIQVRIYVSIATVITKQYNLFRTSKMLSAIILLKILTHITFEFFKTKNKKPLQGI